MIPKALRNRDKWICWRYKERNNRTTKLPVSAEEPDSGRVDATDPFNWVDYETATQTVAQADHVDGAGFVFNTDGPIVGVDLDDCRNPDSGTIEPQALEIVNRLDTYTEISPSGTGLHSYLFADRGLPGDRNRSGKIEIYAGNRFFTVTGNHLESSPKSVTTAQSELEAVYNEHIGEEDTAPSEPIQGDHVTTGDPSTATLEDQKLIEKAKNAKNGSKFRRLWNGDTTGYESHSEARLALLNMLAFWCGKDPQQMNTLFQESGLYPHPEKSGKWERIRDREIQKAIVDTQNTYNPGYHVDNLPEKDDTVATPDGGRLKISNPTVSRIVTALEKLGEASTAEIEEHPAVDRCERQVRRAINDYLEQKNVVESKRDGRKVVYSLVNQ